MKPLQLSIEGLHSFKEKQTIDFEQLGETGLFGIFGKTGSGKSTVLDAMTLALYGVVFRAARQTQGVLNSQRDKLVVSFSFAIGAGAERKIYRVERGFKRNKEKRDSIQTVICRLVEVRSEQEIVLAENTNEVTRKVEEIIGLNMEDFTRSVVLPQGEFSKFIQLKDAERVRMLERIFVLADYGSRLSEKVKQERERVTRELELLERAIQEQGEVSAEQLEILKTEVAQKEADLARLTRETADFEQKYAEQRDLWQLQTELEQALTKQHLHLQSRNEMALKKAILEQAELAQQVLPYLENAQKATAELACSREQLQTTSVAHQNETLLNQQVKAEFVKVETIYLQKQPELIAKRTQIEGILALETEKQAKEIRQSEVTREMERFNALIMDYDTKLSETEREKGVKEAQRQDLEVSIKRLGQDASFKEQFWQGVNLEKEVERNRAQREKIQTDLELQRQQQIDLQRELEQKRILLIELTGQLDHLQVQMQEHQSKKPGDFESYAKSTQELSRLENAINQIMAVETELKTFQAALGQLHEIMKPLHLEKERLNAALVEEQQKLKQLEELQVRLTAEVRSLEEKNLIAGLARSLRAGKPCPVCGSSHHPRLAELKNGMAEQKKTKLVEIENELQLTREQLEQINRDIFQCLIQTEQSQSRCQETQTKIDISNTKLVELRGALDPAIRNKAHSELVSYLKQVKDEMETYCRSISIWDEQRQRLQQELSATRENQITADNQVRLLLAQTESYGKNRQKMEEDVQTTEKAIIEQRRELQSLQQKLQVAGFQEEQARLLDNEREIDAMRETVARLTTELTSLETVGANLRQERETVNLKVWECKTTAENLALEIAEREAKIAAVTDGKNPQELLTAINEYLAKLIQKYEDLKERWEASQTSLQNFTNQLVEVRKHLELSQEAAAESNLALGRALQEKGFLHQNDLQNAMRSKSEQAVLKARITEYEDAGKCYQHQVESLNQKIAGRQINTAEWQEALTMKEQLTTRREQFLADSATIQAKLAEMETRFAKVSQYEQERRGTANRKAMVDEIAKLLQGEAFVAYIAEEHMRYILWDASRRLEMLTGGRYLLSLDENKDFSVVDNTNGGIARPVSSLSGGETFLVSLALALSLSGKIQLNGRNPLEFFFLDEGFGTLDPQLLEVVMDSLEKLRQENLTIGVISHMPELRNRISRRLIVTAANPNGTGSRVHIEKA